MEFRGQRVTVAGLGHFGGNIAAARWFVGQGAKVLVTDWAPTEALVEAVAQLQGLDVQWRLGEHRETDFTTADLVVASPALAPWHPCLVAARKALPDLLSPSAIDIANAKQAVATADQTLKTAQQNLKYAENPVGQSLYDSVSSTQLALDTAKANQQLATVGTEATTVKTTLDDMNLAYSRLQRAQVEMDDCIKISCGERVQRENSLNSAQKAYQTAWDAYQTAKLAQGTSVANQSADVKTAQEGYDQAVANLNAALAGPDKLKVADKQAALEVAQADLTDKQDTLNKLLNGADPNDIAAAEAKVLQEQQLIDSLTLKAPFDGEILAVDFQPNDAATSTSAAVVLANRSQLYVDVSVDEADISQVKVGDSATLTLDALPELELAGKVAQITHYGQTVSGLVKYTVRVTLDKVEPEVLNGMTASVTIVTSVDEGALVVPIAAVQEDASGNEYVNRVKNDGTVEKVKVVSGAVQDNDTVVVTGDLKAGDRVQTETSATTTSSTSSNSTRNNGGGPAGGGLVGGPGGP